MGVPVLGLNHSGTAELIHDKKTGFLFNDNIDSLENELKNIINLTPEEKHKITDAAFEYVLQNFSIEKYTKQLIKLISNIL